MYDYAVNDGTGAGGCAAGCAGNCFTASAYGDVDGDTVVALILLARPNVSGDDCTDLVLGTAPVNRFGVTVHDQPLAYPDLLGAGKY
jgi:hypothetical protein